MSMLLWPDGAPYAVGTSSEDMPTLTPYVLEQSELAGAGIICPGGGYGSRAEHEGEPVARWLNSIGISAFVLNYRVAPYRHPVPWLDAARAIRYVRYSAKDFHIDPERVGILGFSAGGHLASTVSTHFDLGNQTAVDPIEGMSCRPDLAILCYPVISFIEDLHMGSMINLLGDTPNEDLRQSLSSETQVTDQTPPTFIWHTAEDAGVPVTNSLRYAQALSAKKIPFELHVYEKGAHGLGLALDSPGASSWTSRCADWLKAQGFSSL